MSELAELFVALHDARMLIDEGWEDVSDDFDLDDEDDADAFRNDLWDEEDFDDDLDLYQDVRAAYVAEIQIVRDYLDVIPMPLLNAWVHILDAEVQLLGFDTATETADLELLIDAALDNCIAAWSDLARCIDLPRIPECPEIDRAFVLLRRIQTTTQGVVKSNHYQTINEQYRRITNAVHDVPLLYGIAHWDNAALLQEAIEDLNPSATTQSLAAAADASHGRAFDAVLAAVAAADGAHDPIGVFAGFTYAVMMARYDIDVAIRSNGTAAEQLRTLPDPDPAIYNAHMVAEQVIDHFQPLEDLRSFAARAATGGTDRNIRALVIEGTKRRNDGRLRAALPLLDAAHTAAMQAGSLDWIEATATKLSAALAEAAEHEVAAHATIDESYHPVLGMDGVSHTAGLERARVIALDGAIAAHELGNGFTVLEAVNDSVAYSLRLAELNIQAALDTFALEQQAARFRDPDPSAWAGLVIAHIADLHFHAGQRAQSADLAQRAIGEFAADQFGELLTVVIHECIDSGWSGAATTEFSDFLDAWQQGLSEAKRRTGGNLHPELIATSWCEAFSRACDHHLVALEADTHPDFALICNADQSAPASAADTHAIRASASLLRAELLTKFGLRGRETLALLHRAQSSFQQCDDILGEIQCGALIDRQLGRDNDHAPDRSLSRDEDFGPDR